MAKTPAQRQREYMERKKEAEIQASRSLSGVYKKPFFEFYGEHGFDLDFDLALALAGIKAPQFEDDRGPEDFILNKATVEVDDPFMGASRSVGRAEVMTDCLIDAASALAWRLNEYKRAEVKARLAEIEASDLTDPATKKAALKDVTRLNKLLDQLDKQVRWTFPQWKVTG